MILVPCLTYESHQIVTDTGVFTWTLVIQLDHAHATTPYILNMINLVMIYVTVSG